VSEVSLPKNIVAHGLLSFSELPVSDLIFHLFLFAVISFNKAKDGCCLWILAWTRGETQYSIRSLSYLSDQYILYLGFGTVAVVDCSIAAAMCVILYKCSAGFVTGISR
jgi:hypothetical protein